MSLKWASVPTKRLSQPISSSQLTLSVSDIKDWAGNNLTSAYFGTRLFVGLRNSQNTLLEIIEVDPTTIANASITIVTRGLDFNGGTTNVAANALSWPANDTLVDFASDLPQLFALMVVDLYNNQTINGLKTFATLPQSSATPANAADFATKTYVDTHGSGATNYDQQIFAAVAGENLTKGWAVYLNTSDGKWYGANATTSATSEGVLLGIAQATATAGAAVNVLINGPDRSNTGLTVGAIYYLTNSKGVIGTSPGTKTVAIGQVDTLTTELVFQSAFSQHLTQDQINALAGDQGTPSTTNKFLTQSSVPSGSIIQYGGVSAPGGWLLCDGSAVSRSTYAGLFSALNPNKGTVTVTIASPGVFTLNGHGLVAGDAIYLTTTGALPTGLSANTVYYVISAGLTANAFEVSATYGGSAVNTTGSQSGTHTLFRTPHGLGDGSTTFNVPDLRGRVAMGIGTGAGNNVTGSGGTSGTALTNRVLGGFTGEETHQLVTAEMPSHTHSVPSQNVGTFQGGTSGNSTKDGTETTGSTGGDGAHNNMQPVYGLNYIIKT